MGRCWRRVSECSKRVHRELATSLGKSSYGVDMEEQVEGQMIGAEETNRRSRQKKADPEPEARA